VSCVEGVFIREWVVLVVYWIIWALPILLLVIGVTENLVLWIIASGESKLIFINIRAFVKDALNPLFQMWRVKSMILALISIADGRLHLCMAPENKWGGLG